MDAHKPRKRFGQNFLTDQGIINQIVHAIAPHDKDLMVEIGPGQGALTVPLLETCNNLHVVELDRDLVARLEQLKVNYPQLTIHSGDALKFDFATIAEPSQFLRIVGNLPYNISTPLIIHLLDYAPHIHDMHFMLQKEVVDRIAASPGNKNYGRLTVLVQYYCRADSLFEVPPESFFPAPKVNSAIVRLAPYTNIPFPADNFALFRRLVNSCFQHRRKTLRNNLRALLPLEALADLDVDLTQRPEQLSVADYVSLANRLHNDFADQISP